MSLNHLRVQFRGMGGYWWFAPGQYDILRQAILEGAPWVELLDLSGALNVVNVSDVVAFYIWTPEAYDSEAAFSEAVRDYCGADDDDEDLLPGDEWKIK